MEGVNGVKDGAEELLLLLIEPGVGARGSSCRRRSGPVLPNTGLDAGEPIGGG